MFTASDRPPYLREDLLALVSAWMQQDNVGGGLVKESLLILFCFRAKIVDPEEADALERIKSRPMLLL